jgi:hypothetical protein
LPFKRFIFASINGLEADAVASVSAAFRPPDGP